MREAIKELSTEDKQQTPKIITRDMIEEHLDIEGEIILNEGMYHFLPIYIPYYHSLILEGMYDFEEFGCFYFELTGEDYLEFPELVGYTFLVICLSEVRSEGCDIDYELY